MSYPVIEPASLSQFNAPYAPADETLVPALMTETALPSGLIKSIEERAKTYIEHIRSDKRGIGGLEDFMHEYSLSTREGLALMALAEALLRVPDAKTQDRLIADKLGEGDWDHSDARDSENWLVSATTWALGLGVRIVQPGDTPESIIGHLSQRIGTPAIRTAARQAMRLLGYQFVLGETIEAALKRAQENEKRGYRFSFDMLGEGARTRNDADRYFSAYADAIDAIGAKAGDRPLPERPGISVKLSALDPSYDARHGDLIRQRLGDQLLLLAQQAKSYDLNLTVDAEEADRLELSLDIFGDVLADPSLRGWDGFGLAVQAYQKRGTSVIDWIADCAASSGRKLMVRLVKGAYWDTEIKRAQERGLSDYPVFTRKPATDLAYLACAKRMLDARPNIYPQFATHNALTVATIIEIARDQAFEFQRLHGMGEGLFDQVHEEEGYPCRIYAPVGSHKELLAYLVRRLLENGANSSFINSVNDSDVPVDSLLTSPAAALKSSGSVRHGGIPLPRDIFAPRMNSKGLEFGDHAALDDLLTGMAETAFPAKDGASSIGGERALAQSTRRRSVLSPADGQTIVGAVVDADVEIAEQAVANARLGFQSWASQAVEDRAKALENAADIMELRRDELMALLAMEAGKTLEDGIAEIREAVDFCRYYAAEARRHCQDQRLPGPTGEENQIRLRGRGVFICISPWNFPLAIFLGQVTAALAVGNTVVAKPAEQTPLIACRAVEILHAAGVPADALNLVIGDGLIGAALVQHSEISGVAFTGSTEVAQKINRALAAKEGAIVPLIAETGGINAMIADATALPEQVTDDVVMSAFRSAGQRCSAARILFVQDDVADGMIEMIKGAAMELILGAPEDPATDMGPVIDLEAKNALMDHIGRMAKEQTLLFAGQAPTAGYFVAPHIIELDDPAVLDREVFGPILHVHRWKAGELDRVLRAIQETGYGLTFGVHTRVGGRAERIADALEVGNIYVNRNTIGAIVGSQPFGGSGLSGTGPKAGGPNYLPRFAQEQVISIDTTAAGGNASLVTMEDTPDND